MKHCEKCGCVIVLGECRSKDLHTPGFKKCIWNIQGKVYRFKWSITKEQAVTAIKKQEDVLLKPPGRF